MLQCKHIVTMSQQAKADLLNALLKTKEGYAGKDEFFTNYGLCSNVTWSGGGTFNFKSILFEMFKNTEFPFNDDTNSYSAEEDKSTNPKRMKFLNELIATLEASVEQMG